MQVDIQATAEQKTDAEVRKSQVINALMTSSPPQIKQFVDNNYPSLTQAERDDLSELYMALAYTIRRI